MIVLANIVLWTLILSVAAVAWTLLWSDAMDRRRAIRAAHEDRWRCACACPSLPGYHSHGRCEF